MIEWGELIKDALPKNYIHVTFEKDDNDENIRILNLDLPDSFNINLLNKLEV